MTARGQTSWYGFAKHIIDSIPPEDKMVKCIIPIKTKDYSYKAERPLYSVMGNSKLYSKYRINQNDWRAYPFIMG